MNSLCTEKNLYLKIRVNRVLVDNELSPEALPSYYLKKGSELILFFSESPAKSSKNCFNVTCNESFHLITPEHGTTDSFVVYLDVTDNRDLDYSGKISNDFNINNNGIEILSELFGNDSVKGIALVFQHPFTTTIYAEVTISAIPAPWVKKERNHHHIEGATSMNAPIDRLKFGR
jgi:hypothetical protein